MTRHITPHKGGRTARAPEARIRPQTLQRIKATMQERKASFADLLEETYSGENDMSGLTPDFRPGDEVNIKSHGRWEKDRVTVKSTWYTSEDGRVYTFNERGDMIVNEANIRKAK